jgi:hypothetical protein
LIGIDIIALKPIEKLKESSFIVLIVDLKLDTVNSSPAIF